MSVILYVQYSYSHYALCILYYCLCIYGVLYDTRVVHTIYVEMKLNHSHTSKTTVTGQWFTYIKVCV